MNLWLNSLDPPLISARLLTSHKLKELYTVSTFNISCPWPDTKNKRQETIRPWLQEILSGNGYTFLSAKRFSFSHSLGQLISVGPDWKKKNRKVSAAIFLYHFLLGPSWGRGAWWSKKLKMKRNIRAAEKFLYHSHFFVHGPQ